MATPIAVKRSRGKSACGRMCARSIHCRIERPHSRASVEHSPFRLHQSHRSILKAPIGRVPRSRARCTSIRAKCRHYGLASTCRVPPSQVSMRARSPSVRAVEQRVRFRSRCVSRRISPSITATTLPPISRDCGGSTRSLRSMMPLPRRTRRSSSLAARSRCSVARSPLASTACRPVSRRRLTRTTRRLVKRHETCSRRLRVS